MHPAAPSLHSSGTATVPPRVAVVAVLIAVVRRMSSKLSCQRSRRPSGCQRSPASKRSSQQRGLAPSTETLSTLTYKTLFSALQFGYGSALATAMFLTEAAIALAFGVFLVRQMRRTEG